MLEVSLVRVRTVLRPERDSWSNDQDKQLMSTLPPSLPTLTPTLPKGFPSRSTRGFTLLQAFPDPDPVPTGWFAVNVDGGIYMPFAGVSLP